MTRKYNTTIIDHVAGQTTYRSANWSSVVDKCIFAYVVFVLITFTTAFWSFQLDTQSAGLVYLGGVVLIGFQSPGAFLEAVDLVAGDVVSGLCTDIHTLGDRPGSHFAQLCPAGVHCIACCYYRMYFTTSSTVVGNVGCFRSVDSGFGGEPLATGCTGLPATILPTRR